MKKYLLWSIILVSIIQLSSIIKGAALPIFKKQELSAQPIQSQEPLNQSQEIYIPLIAKGLQANYWCAVEEGARRAAKDYNVKITFEGPMREGQTKEQLKMLETALNKNPAAIILSAVDASAATPYLQEAQDKGIPVIGFDSGVNSPIVKTTVATDNYGAGALAAEKMAQLLEEKGKVAIIVQDTTSKVATDRRDGFVNTIEQQYPNMEVVEIGYGGGEVEQSAAVAKKMIQTHPDIKGIFGGNEGSARGVIKAVKDLNKVGEITIVGFDSGQDIIDAIREGVAAGAVTQHPREMGYEAVETAIKAYNGETLPAFIDTGYTWYDKSNIDNPEVQKHLYK